MCHFLPSYLALGHVVYLAFHLLNILILIYEASQVAWGREPLLKGKASIVDLLVLTSLDQLLLILQTLFTFTQNKVP